jgi:hypothetical protein
MNNGFGKFLGPYDDRTWVLNIKVIGGDRSRIARRQKKALVLVAFFDSAEKSSRRYSSD